MDTAVDHHGQAGVGRNAHLCGALGDRRVGGIDRGVAHRSHLAALGGHVGPVVVGPEELYCQIAALHLGHELDGKLRVVAEPKVQRAGGEGGVQPGREVVHRKGVVDAGHDLQVGIHGAVVQGGGHLAHAAALHGHRFSARKAPVYHEALGLPAFAHRAVVAEHVAGHEHRAVALRRGQGHVIDPVLAATHVGLALAEQILVHQALGVGQGVVRLGEDQGEGQCLAGGGGIQGGLRGLHINGDALHRRRHLAVRAHLDGHRLHIDRLIYVGGVQDPGLQGLRGQDQRPLSVPEGGNDGGPGRVRIQPRAGQAADGLHTLFPDGIGRFHRVGRHGLRQPVHALVNQRLPLPGEVAGGVEPEPDGGGACPIREKAEAAGQEGPAGDETLRLGQGAEHPVRIGGERLGADDLPVCAAGYGQRVGAVHLDGPSQQLLRLRGGKPAQGHLPPAGLNLHNGPVGDPAARPGAQGKIGGGQDTEHRRSQDRYFGGKGKPRLFQPLPGAGIAGRLRRKTLLFHRGNSLLSKRESKRI